MTPLNPAIYHFTDVSNLPSIIAQGGLCSNNQMQTLGLTYQNIAYQSIQGQRGDKQVPCGPGGTLHDYIPFYFAPRSPMLYTISWGNVPNYTKGQAPLVYLVSTVEDIQSAGLDFVFTDGHGIMRFTSFFDSLANLGQVDWDVMNSQFWNDTPQCPDRKRKRQAEFLVHNFFPWGLVYEIGVIDNEMRTSVLSSLNEASHQPIVTVHEGWYY